MTNETQKPDEQPYFTVKVTRCGECPHNIYAACSLEPITPAIRWLENSNGITPTCPMWPQRVQEKKDE